MGDLDCQFLLIELLYGSVELPIFGKDITWNAGPDDGKTQFKRIVGHQSLLYDLLIA